MYHGNHGGNGLSQGVAHAGLCLTTDRDAAGRYARTKGTVWSCELDLDGLTVERVEGYSWDSDVAVGDDDASLAELQARGVDVVMYDDADESGRKHDCIRIVSERAVAMVALVRVTEDSDDEEEGDA